MRMIAQLFATSLNMNQVLQTHAANISAINALVADEAHPHKAKLDVTGDAKTKPDFCTAPDRRRAIIKFSNRKARLSVSWRSLSP